MWFRLGHETRIDLARAALPADAPKEEAGDAPATIPMPVALGILAVIGVAALSFTMDKSWGTQHWSTGKIDRMQQGDIALNAEGCGGTYVSKIDEDYNITRIDPHVIGKTTSDGRCSPELPASPDNILALNDGTLLIGEDAGPKRHVLDMLWMVR